MPYNNGKPIISITTIQRQYKLTFHEVMQIAKDAGWKNLDSRRMVFDLVTVQSYFAKNGITRKTINWQQIVKEYGVKKTDVFKLIKICKWRPISTRGISWLYSYPEVAAWFANPHNAYLVTSGRIFEANKVLEVKKDSDINNK
jgi:hypothetical protein